jgi:hypothetical protein
MRKPKNIAGPVIARARCAMRPPVSCELLSQMLDAVEVTLSADEIAAVEAQQRVLRDYELIAIMRLLRIAPGEVL